MTQGVQESVDNGETPLEAAIKRLERAVAVLDGQVTQLSGRADGAAGGLFDVDRSQLAVELDAAKARERAMADAGAATAEAMARSSASVRQALQQAGEA